MQPSVKRIPSIIAFARKDKTVSLFRKDTIPLLLKTRKYCCVTIMCLNTKTIATTKRTAKPKRQQSASVKACSVLNVSIFSCAMASLMQTTQTVYKSMLCAIRKCSPQKRLNATLIKGSKRVLFGIRKVAERLRWRISMSNI